MRWKPYWFYRSLKQFFCKHELTIDMRDSVKDRWKIVSSVACCEKCEYEIPYSIVLFDYDRPEKETPND